MKSVIPSRANRYTTQPPRCQIATRTAIATPPLSHTATAGRSHTFATRALSAGVDVMALQKALGHTTLAMVSRYVHYQKDDLLEAWQRRRD